MKVDFNSRALKAVLAVSFVLSALVGSYILANDAYLCSAAPTHAYGLVAFVAVDLIAVVGIYALPRATRVAALLVPSVQLTAMAGDLYMGLGSPGSVIQGAFRQYLLNDSAYMALLVLEAVLVGLALCQLLLFQHRGIDLSRDVAGLDIDTRVEKKRMP